MFKLILGAMLLATATLAQNPPASKAKSAKANADGQPVQLGRSSSAAGKDAAGSGNKNTTAKAVSRKPIPPSSASEKTKSNNDLNPNYGKEEAKGRGISPKYDTPKKIKVPRKD